MNKNLISYDKQTAYTHKSIFNVGEEVKHQDETVGTAIIESFDWSKTHEGEILVTTTEGTTHLDFLVKI
jgi:hypothetical protein